MRRCLVMGIVNVTPDSFSDGGKYFSAEEAIKRVYNEVEEGADIIDLGGESTRPGATPIAWTDEWARLEPVIAEVAGKVPALSVDTYHPETAERALGAGANLVNCVYAEPVAAMARLVAAHPGAELVLPASAAGAPGVAELRDRVYFDPMVGFGTTREEDLELIRSIPELARRSRVLVGVSRKRIVKKLTGGKVLGKNLGGNLALTLWCAQAGAAAVRVHDVRETVQALKVLEALRT